MTTLIVSEKPSIAKSIATLISDNNYSQLNSIATPVY